VSSEIEHGPIWPGIDDRSSAIPRPGSSGQQERIESRRGVPGAPHPFYELSTYRSDLAGASRLRASAGWWQDELGCHFGRFHAPVDHYVRGGVVLCPPLLDDPYWTHRSYRFLAARLTASGFAVLHLDYTGTGDSPGEPSQVGKVGIWSDDIQAASLELRRRGAQFVAAVAMRAAANLLSGIDEPVADALVLWDPVSSGRAYLREVLLLHRAELETVSHETDSDLGYGYPPSMVESLRALGPCQSTARPTLLLTRKGRPTAGTEVGAQTDLARARGQDRLLSTYLDAASTPEDTVGDIVEWISGRAPEHSSVIDSALDCTWTTEHHQERVHIFGSGLFAIETRPPTTLHRAHQALTCLMFNSGAQHHIGPQRLHVDLSRDLATGGIRSVRLDFRGLGDSAPPPREESSLVYGSWCIEDLETALQHFADGPSAAIGLCSGAYHALEAAARWPLVGAIAIHPPADLGVLAARLVRDKADRPVARAVGHRPWLRFATRSRLGRSWRQRVPGPLWHLLDATHLQPDPRRALDAASHHGAAITVLLEASEASAPPLWSLLHRPMAPNRVVVNTVDHALFATPGRQLVQHLCREQLLEWAYPPCATGPAIKARASRKPNQLPVQT